MPREMTHSIHVDRGGHDVQRIMHHPPRPRVKLMTVKHDTSHREIAVLANAWTQWNVPTRQQDAWLRQLCVDEEFRKTYIVRLYLQRRGYVPIAWAGLDIYQVYHEITSIMKLRRGLYDYD